MGKLKLFQVYQGDFLLKRKSQFLTDHFISFKFCILGLYKSGHLDFWDIKTFKNNIHMLNAVSFISIDLFYGNPFGKSVEINLGFEDKEVLFKLSHPLASI